MPQLRCIVGRALMASGSDMVSAARAPGAPTSTACSSKRGPANRLVDLARQVCTNSAAYNPWGRIRVRRNVIIWVALSGSASASFVVKSCYCVLRRVTHT
jgi:hypothetical protein